jgi:hypothetical protein
MPKMANRFMVDCTHANLHKIDSAFLKTNQLIGGYDTGSPDVKWTSDDWNYVKSLGLIPVHIDQGFTGSPVNSDVVRDVEPGAWNAVTAETKPWTAVRKTIYCDRNDLMEVLQLGWKGDIWLAWPLNSIPSKDFVLSAYPALSKANLVAVQIGFTGVYDHSVIYDPYWPLAIPQTIKVPNVIGMTEQDASETLYHAGLHPHGPPLVKVIQQTPVAGTMVTPGSTVSVVVR